MINSANIRSSLESLFAGTTGIKRKITSGAMAKGHDSALEGLSLVGLRYDINFGDVTNHPATPFSILSSYRLVNLPVEITLTSHLPSEIEEAARDTVRASIVASADAVAQAIGYPGNVATTSGGSATGIVSGMFQSLSIGAVQENLDKQIITCKISATAVVKVDQATT